MTTPDFTYLFQAPSKYTFEQSDLKLWVERWCKGTTLNLFAGKVKLNVDEVRIDIDGNMLADYHMDALKFIAKTHRKFDTVLLDPPYNLRKAREKYGGRFIGSFQQVRAGVLTVLRPFGRIITLGYDSVGMGSKRGFSKIAICLVCHGGDHNDTICLVEEMIQTQLA